MNVLVLGRGKTGSLVADVARQRGHDVRAVGSAENRDGAAVTADALRGTEMAIDFTTPQAVIGNIEACARAGVNLIVGTTGWYGEIARVCQLVDQSGIGLLYAANFSVGVNLFFDIVRASAPALGQGYSGHITEQHHAKKKDAPSGTAAALRAILLQERGGPVEITSIREGDVVGTHTLALESPNDTITLTHAAKSRLGFAEGAVRAAEWLLRKRGFFDFKDVFRQL
jgi:4-hydroxy-tetrahydrodipicolinate reductase